MNTAVVRKPDRKRVLLVVLVVVAVVAIPGRLAWSMRSSALDQASETRDQAHLLEDQVAQARRDKARAGELNDQLQALSAALPAEADLPSIVEQLQAVARESNVSFVSSSQTPPAARAATAPADATTTTAPTSNKASSSSDGSDDGSGSAASASAAAGPASASFLVEVDVVGTASNLTAYLEKLRSLPRVLTVERLAWTWQDGTGGAGAQAVTAHFTVRAYTWAGATKAVPGATTVPPTSKAP